MNKKYKEFDRTPLLFCSFSDSEANFQPTQKSPNFNEITAIFTQKFSEQFLLLFLLVEIDGWGEMKWLLEKN